MGDPQQLDGLQLEIQKNDMDDNQGYPHDLGNFHMKPHVSNDCCGTMWGRGREIATSW